jgi:hypothetical protein
MIILPVTDTDTKTRKTKRKKFTAVAEFGEEKQRKGSKKTEKRGEKDNREVYFVVLWML